MATTSNESDSSPKNTDIKENDSKDKQNNMYECSICWDNPKDPVVGFCGHLFCWPCLRLWLEARPYRQRCPMCKAVINKDKVIPIYGRGNTNPEDPRKRLPFRPPSSFTINAIERIISNYNCVL